MLQLRLLPSIEKTVVGAEPSAGIAAASALWEERFSFQAVCRYDAAADEEHFVYRGLTLSGDPRLTGSAELFLQQPVSVGLACYPESDGDPDYLTHDPALIPDALLPLPHSQLSPDSELPLPSGQWIGIWLTVTVPTGLPGGEYALTVRLTGGEQPTEQTLCLTVVPAALPPQTLIVTQWFHADCIARRYRVPVFSEAHWTLVERYMQCAADHGQNMILTPVFTPALDTEIGTERPTVQLTDVTVTDAGYTFGFERLARWIDTARRAGLRYFEISHLFTQWGAAHAPKIMGCRDGREQRLFGWETDARSDEYQTFVRAFLTALAAFLKQKGVYDDCRFHVSDEPNPGCIDNWRAAASVIKSVIGEEKIIDALSDIEYYKEGLIRNPIPANNCMEPFLAAGVPALWTYYCCGQGTAVSNRFIAMPGRRTRVIGLQFYKFGIAGFLQWGYNFWNGHLSKFPIDPFLTTDAYGVFPSGDAYTVYPGPDGPLPSIRQKLFYEALQDQRALTLLERLAGKEAALALLEQSAGPLTFTEYPRSDERLLAVRERVNAAIAAKL